MKVQAAAAVVLALAAVPVFAKPFPDSNAPQVGDVADGVKAISVEVVSRGILSYWDDINDDHDFTAGQDQHQNQTIRRSVGPHNINATDLRPIHQDPGADRKVPTFAADYLKTDLCPNVDVQCYPSHLAREETCRDLIDSLEGDTHPVHKSPRAICLKRGDDQCCISWSRKTAKTLRESLMPASYAVLDVCRTESSKTPGVTINIAGMALEPTIIHAEGFIISGQVRAIQMGEWCATICVSNRASGCKGDDP